MALEREVKLEVTDGYALPDLNGVEGMRTADRGVRVLHATYWDTEGLDLLRAGYGLRHRTTDGAHGTWTLKGESATAGEALVREETEVPGDPVRPAEDALKPLPPRLRGSALQPVATLRTQRHIVDLLGADGSRWAELADDRVDVLDGDAVVSSFRELEVEVVGDDEAARLAAVVGALRAAGAKSPSDTAKYVRALRALGRTDLPE